MIPIPRPPSPPSINRVREDGFPSILPVRMVVTVVVRLQLRGAMRMIMRLQLVVGVIVLVALFACGMMMAVAVLMSVRMDVRVRMLMIVNRFAVAMLMPVRMGMPMLVLMPVLVATAHEGISFACLDLHDRDRQFRPVPAAPSFERFFYPAEPCQGYAGGEQPATVPSARPGGALAKAVAMETAGKVWPPSRPHVFADANILVRSGGQEDIVNLPRAGFTSVGQEAPASS